MIRFGKHLTSMEAVSFVVIPYVCAKQIFKKDLSALLYKTKSFPLASISDITLMNVQKAVTTLYQALWYYCIFAEYEIVLESQPVLSPFVVRFDSGKITKTFENRIHYHATAILEMQKSTINVQKLRTIKKETFEFETIFFFSPLFSYHTLVITFKGSFSAFGILTS